ncbi:hypothetical protein EUTSA_v10015818mg [Eutrema salsugineum]|uniref:PUM-HD domain-containing protein n=1 Tax=Eutrema salsugineum TaxID=72664 RepID=V4LM28_EUTSA|nr:putative pumilio homolog 21 [Eutrema salsugineum]ESQ40893.1 hypothetical protein EUTSA_v10015818mg [Eutrema salsugineum]
MSNGKGPMSDDDDDGEYPIPNDTSSMFSAFQKLFLQSNNNNNELEESSHMINKPRESNYMINRNKNHNLNIQYNLDQVSLGASRRLPQAAGFRAPPPPPPLSWITQPHASSSTYSGQRHSAYPQSCLRSEILRDQEMLYLLLNMMTCPTRDSKFPRYLETIDTYQTVKRERCLLHIGSMITTTNSIFFDLARNQNGSHALRALLRRSSRLDAIIFEAVCENFMWLMNDKFGRYLIVPTIRAVDEPRKEMLYKLTFQNTLSLAVEETGCVALNAVFQEIKGRFRDLIFNKIARLADCLALHPYGTYVVQEFLTLQNPRATQAIAETLYGNFFKLAKEKEGSYVVEKCLKSEFGREKVLEEFRKNDKEWVRMAKDKFGNYVAQCALRVMKQRGKKAMLREFVEKLRPHFAEMKFGYGRNTLRVIEEEIEAFIPKFPDDLLDLLY